MPARRRRATTGSISHRRARRPGDHAGRVAAAVRRRARGQGEALPRVRRGAAILFDTSRIIHGGETNYIRATISLYLSVYNIFVHLLSMLGILGSDD